MNSKIDNIQLYLKNIIDKRVSTQKYKIIIIKNSYFFVIHKGYEEKFYTSGHKDIKGWYSGILSFSKADPDLFHIFISDIYYNQLSTEDLFLKIVYQIIMHLNFDYLKLKYKKSRKQLYNYLKNNLPKNIEINDLAIDNLLNSKEDLTLFHKAGIIIPHMSLFTLLDRLPASDKDIIYLNEIQTHLEPFEYMIEDHEEHQLEHHHETHEHY
ncbi:hypothetical protein A3K80_01525 [Candidatus Bathyarchaeota archaeon RBG_13_38_9]|nr:MAG: hypothetical protein A3K80_01525 [Candidatus Bathyarchaeota archaeon RBG_13_38_9]